MPTGKLYKKLAEIKGLRISQLEAKLKVPNATIANSIKRNSTIKKAALDNLTKTFPDVDFLKLEMDMLKEEFEASPEGKAYKEALLNEEISANDPKVGTSDVEGGSIPDPAMPGIYQDIVKALIKASDEMAESSKVQRKISEALLEERQLIRETAQAAISLADRANEIANLRASLDELIEESEAAQVFFLQKIAALEPNGDAEELAGELDNVLLAVPSAKSRHRPLHSHK